MWFNLVNIILNIMIINVCAKDLFPNYDDEFDPILELLLNPDQYEHNENNENNIDEKLVLIEDGNDNIWTCGDCTEIEKSKLIYEESYNFEANGYENDEINTQMGLSLEAMRCITVRTERKGQVFRTAGTCSSEVTLRVVNTNRCDISVFD